MGLQAFGVVGSVSAEERPQELECACACSLLDVIGVRVHAFVRLGLNFETTRKRTKSLGVLVKQERFEETPEYAEFARSGV